MSIHLMVTDGEHVVDLSADMEVTVHADPNDPNSSLHMVEVLQQSVLTPCLEHEQARLKPGKYSVRLLAVITSVSE